jgi:hypothetical protein
MNAALRSRVHEGRDAASERFDMQIGTEDRYLRERRADDLILQVRIFLQDEPDPAHQDKQRREDREKPVVGDRGCQIAALIVGVLLPHRG